MSKASSLLKFTLLPASVFLLCSANRYLDAKTSQSASRQFETFTDTLFRNEVVSNTLNLHYTLEHPEDYGITDYPVTYGATGDISLVSSEAPSADDYRQILYGIPYENLSTQDQLTYDILSLYLENEKRGEAYSLYYEPLGSTIGVQAQLPILLSEYAFYSQEDIDTYLELITQTDSYFAALAEYETEKSAAGLFMSDTNADAIIRQCRAFLASDPQEHFLVTLFNEKVDGMKGLSNAQKTSFKQQNLAAITEHIVPAYDHLVKRLEQLKGTGCNENGLSYFPLGKSYYEYLIRSSTGSYLPISAIEKRIRQQLETDLTACRDLLKGNPALGQNTAFDNLTSDPQTILSDLEESLPADFPAAPSVHYEVKYVHDSLEEFLSPAFYLTPPIDNLNDHVIYINRASDYSPLELYTTLAHEGYPGHLYQHVLSDRELAPVRSILSFGGYTEGWATYVEMESYRYAAAFAAKEGDADAASISAAKAEATEEIRDAAELVRLNRSIMLGLSSLLDIYIHYHGFTREDTAVFLENLGIVNKSSADALFDAIVESPANYLKYYLGYLTFSDLKAWCETRYTEQFDLKDFHKQVLAIGPCPFPVLEKYLKSYYESDN